MLTVGLAANALGALLLLALGVAILLVVPRRAASVALGAFALTFGAAAALQNLRQFLPDHADALQAAEWGFRAVGIPATLALLLVFPAPIATGEGRLLALPVAYLAVAISAALAFYNLEPLRAVIIAVHFDGRIAAALLLALRAAASPNPATHPQFALASVALALHPAVVRSPASSLPEEVVGDAITFAALVLTAGAWLVAGTRGVDPKLARNTAWWILGFGALGALIGAPELRGFGVSGLLFVLMVALLAYAILRHQLLGIDVRLRWTISRGTVAAAFVAAFFLAGEGAQIAFGATNEWIGLAAAGALVFALAPLQRAAERLAAAAVPVAVPAASPISASDRVATYRRAVAHALRDRALTREEEAYLADLATHLGIDYRTALAIRHEVEKGTEVRV